MHVDTQNIEQRHLEAMPRVYLIQLEAGTRSKMKVCTMPGAQRANLFATKWIEFGLGTKRKEMIDEQVKECCVFL